MLCIAALASSALALNPRKALTQYTRVAWTQAQGLPQDTIRAIAQTADGYLWLGTDEGLARFDGYDFVTFTKDSGALPSNSITALVAGKDGSLYIGTPNGLTRLSGRGFTTYTTKDGLVDNQITSLFEDHNGALWIAAGIYLSRFQNGKFTNYPADALLPVRAVRVVYEDSRDTLWVAGVGGLGRLVNGRLAPVVAAREMAGDFVFTMLEDHNKNLWIAGNKGLMEIFPGGGERHFSESDGLPDNLVRAVLEDRSGNLWAGTNEGLSRLENGKFVAPSLDGGRDRDWVRCLFEDREGNLWVGMNGGLSRFSDDRFTIYGRAEGLPSDEPIAVHQDASGEIWVGFHDGGLVDFGPRRRRVYTTRDGLPSDEIFSIRETRNGDLLIGTREGFSRMHGGHFSNFLLRDPLQRAVVFDMLEDSHGHTWFAGASGVHELIDGSVRDLVPGGMLLNSVAVAISESPDGAIWAGTYGDGLWRVPHEGTGDARARHFTTADGLGSDQIRSLDQDSDGTLWIGTFGGGLNAYRDGAFVRYMAHDGLLSDNISHVEDDGKGSLWLSTTRGICRVSKRQLREFSAGHRKRLSPVNYGVDDGLRSAQCAPGYPAGGGGTRTADGRLWFPTSHGLAVIQPAEKETKSPPPVVQLVEVTADGRDVDFHDSAEIKPGTDRIQFRYTAIHLTAPERVHYSYKLENLDRGWISAGGRRVINYNSLPHGQYRFLIRAILDGQSSADTVFGFTVLPHFYETRWFRWLCAASVMALIYGLYQLRLRQLRGRFSLVLEERARLAREIHDTLAQGFVGISSQLDAVAVRMNGDMGVARQHLETARKMVRHSLTEARRSVMDLRASTLEDCDLPSALATAARQWTMGSSVPVEIDIAGTSRKLPEDVEQNVLRIAQEAVANAIKHSGARRIWVRLETEARRLLLQVKDDGCGFEPAPVFSALDGHFGILGMRERAERLGGELALSSHPGQGTHVEVRVPLS